MLKAHIGSFAYGHKEILHNISFTLKRGEHLAVLGESGCGKSSLLHVVYGLLHLDEGSLQWDGQPLLGPKFNLVPGEPFMKLVAQEFNVMPFTSAFDNVAEHLPRLDMDADKERVLELLEVVGLTQQADQLVRTLSGGQKQRIALAKALAKKPELLLLDEPFSHIDSFRKNALRRRLYGFLKEENIACITATHDSEEALAFSDQLMILKEGTIEALGPPTQVYQAAKNQYQAGFFGEFLLMDPALLGLDSTEKKVVRPHQWLISEQATKIEVCVLNNYFKGSHYLVESSWKGQSLFFVSDKALKPSNKYYLKIDE